MTAQTSFRCSILTFAAAALGSLSISSQTPQQFAAADRVPLADVPYSSSAALSASETLAIPATSAGMGAIVPPAPGRRAVRPFSDVAVAVKVGTGGVGFDVATPLAPRLNLRSGASFFSYNTSFSTDGLNITGSLQFQNAAASVDIYPFNNSFRISPGFTFRNNNHLNAALMVPGGKNFSLGEGADQTSDPSNPIHGTADFAFGNQFAPRFTVGFGNMLPRRGGHFSVPFEVGFQYISTPTVSLNITGQGCAQVAGATTPSCGPVDQTNVQQEQAEIQSDINFLRFYPIASVGLSYRFGHAHQAP